MFSKKIIDSDEFLDMPLETQSLYFHLAMRADDDGFINNARKLIRAIGASQSDLETLIEKGFIIAFESGILAIRHWKVHNYIAKDRYHTTMFVDEKNRLSCDENGAYMDEKESVYNPYTNCIQPVYKVYTQVRLGKDSIGKDSIDKDSIDKDSIVEGSVVEVRLEKERIEEDSLGEVRLEEERIEKDRLEVVEGSIVEDSTYTAPTRTQTNEDYSSLMANATANKGEALHSASITNHGEREDYSHHTRTQTNEDYSSLMANATSNKGEALHSASTTNYGEREDYSHPTRTQTNEDYSSLMANATSNKGEALHSAYTTNHGEREDHTPVPTHNIYKKEDSCNVADSGGFSYSEEGDHFADYSPLNEGGCDEYNWELPRDYVSENPPPIGLDDGYFASLDDKDAPPEDDDLPWCGNFSPDGYVSEATPTIGLENEKFSGEYGDYSDDYNDDISGDWAVTPAPKKRHEAMENPARGLNGKDSALTENAPKDERRTDGIDDLSAPKATRDGGEVKPIFGDHGRGIVCLSEWQLSDLKGRLGEQQLNRYMDKLATFISQRGAHVRSHYDTILKWYNEDFTERERQGTDAPYRENNSPKSTQNYSRTQGYNAPPQHERYGNFDPKEAFRAALRRSFGENFDIDKIKI